MKLGERKERERLTNNTLLLNKEREKEKEWGWQRLSIAYLRSQEKAQLTGMVVSAPHGERGGLSIT